jgi:hypothetical protein
MTGQGTAARSPVAVRRTGHAVGALTGAALLVLIHVWPGWQVLPFLTPDTSNVLGIVDAALVAGILVHLLQLVRDDGWLPPAGLVVTSAFGLAVMVRVLQVFPFAFDSASHWDEVVRIVLVVGIVGAAVGLVVAAISLLRPVAAQTSGPATP